ELFDLGVLVGPLREAFRPDDFALQGGLAERPPPGVGEVEELLLPLLADVDAVPAVVVDLAEGPNEPTLRVEDDDGVLRGLVAVALLLDVDQSLGIDADAVGRLPAKVLGQLAPVVDALVAMLAFAEDGVLRTGLFASGEDGGACPRGEHGGERGLQELPALH